MIFTTAGPITRLERVALVVALGLAVALLWPLRHTIGDDLFIQLQYARHLAAGQGLVFNVGERVYGCTSPLWVTLLADAIALGFDGAGTARVLGFLATIASIGFFFQLLRRTVTSPVVRALGTILWAGHAWLIRFSVTGTETSLAVALMLAGFVAFVEGRQWGARPRRTGALWALAALARPEAAFLLFLWGVFLLIDAEDRDGLRRLVAGAIPPILIYGGWLVFARFYFRTFWPQMLSLAPHHPIDTRLVLANLAHQLRLAAGTETVLALLLLLAAVLGGSRLWLARGATQRFVPWCWVIGLPVLYAVRGIAVTPQHLVLVAPIFAWLAWRAADGWWSAGDGGARRVTGANTVALLVAVLALGQNLLVYAHDVVPALRRQTETMHASLVPWGRWFGRHTETTAVIASPEIGAIAYYSHRRVIDLNGVVTPPLIHDLLSESPADIAAGFGFAAFSRPEYLVDRAPTPYSLLERSRFAAALIPLGHAMPATADTQSASVYSFYRIDWAAFDSIRTAR